MKKIAIAASITVTGIFMGCFYYWHSDRKSGFDSLPKMACGHSVSRSLLRRVLPDSPHVYQDISEERGVKYTDFRNFFCGVQSGKLSIFAESDLVEFPLKEWIDSPTARDVHFGPVHSFNGLSIRTRQTQADLYVSCRSESAKTLPVPRHNNPALITTVTVDMPARISGAALKQALGEIAVRITAHAHKMAHCENKVDFPAHVPAM